eukprot:CCRYP_000891-RA/>CCRYP_000891-RA protein AED:0.45 eAED:0.45 QI:124/1/1/1/0/0/2/0/38
MAKQVKKGRGLEGEVCATCKGRERKRERAVKRERSRER